ncbi:MAG: PxKF domain-containing protein [Chloroflexota bacterium]|nr:PxKF domain-containing protein [Chloroflexota bacterium]
MRKLMVLALLAVALAAGPVVGPSPAESAFPGANGKIVFASDRDGNWEIYVMNADGSGQVKLTNNLADDQFPAWSADGTKIAFSRDCDIYVMNADGSGQTNLTNDLLTCDGQPTWPPDGSKIVFHSDSEIYVMDADGSNRTNLTNSPEDEYDPAWSPDGSKIAFAALPAEPGGGRIDVMDADGGNRITLFGEGGIVGGVEWSPDGSKIAFANGGPPGPVIEIYVIGADGMNLQQLTSIGVVTGWPAWSPDGTKIAFASDVDGDSEIYVMDADGSGQTQLTDNAAQDEAPNWQRLLVYSFSGFFRPVDNPPVLNSVKAGSGMPVKFSLGGDQGLDIFATGYPRSQRINCDMSTLLDAIEETVTAGSSSLSYDPIADQYVYVWKTDKAWASTCRQLIVRLNDGTDHVANFKFK